MMAAVGSRWIFRWDTRSRIPIVALVAGDFATIS